MSWSWGLLMGCSRRDLVAVMRGRRRAERAALGFGCWCPELVVLVQAVDVVAVGAWAGAVCDWSGAVA